MRGKKQIVIDIDADGNCSIEGQGFVGPECGNFIKEIESVLGTRVTQKDKPEYRQRNVNRGRERQIGG